MTKRLIIAEKPSVATDIARAIGGMTKHKDFFENDDFVVSSTIGHLLQICEPTKSRNKKDAGNGRQPSKWALESLPSLPAEFTLQPIQTGSQRLSLLTKLAKRADIEGLINACDAGREGELIFHRLDEYLHLGKPIKRLWLRSMTPAAIRDGLASLLTHEKKAGLRAAAISRQEADWLVGINATRALTALNSKDGGFLLTNVGRVQTPTLALIVSRELERLAHKPKPYWILTARFAVAAGEYDSRWTSKTDRIWEQQQAKDLAAAVTNSVGVAVDESKLLTKNPPPLFDLTSLQREANILHSFSARRTLAAAQALYERYKLTTYPRTDSKHLPPDYEQVVRHTLATIGASKAGSGPQGGPFDMDAVASLSRGCADRVGKVGKAVFDLSRVSDHFAIIPTGELPKATLPESEQRIFNLVCRRFIAVFLPPAKIRTTTRNTTVTLANGDDNSTALFKTRGQVILEPGWLAAEVRKQTIVTLPPLAGAEEQARCVKKTLSDHETKPAARYSEAALLTAMEDAGKLVGDEDLAGVLREQGGLGTPATRAGIIEELIRNAYLVRNGRELVPTRKGISLLELLQGMKIEELTKADLTGKWESRLKEVETGTQTSASFLTDIRQLAARIAMVAKNYDPDATVGDYVKLTTPCPQCQGLVVEKYRKYICQGCGFFIWKTAASRQFLPPEAETLLQDKRCGPLDGFKSRIGREFSASVILEDSGKLTFDFSPPVDSEIDPTTLEQVGSCPKCGQKILADPLSYVCEQHYRQNSCDFAIRRTILQRVLAPPEIAELLAKRKTALLDGFVSKRGSKFAARLTLDDSGKLGFEFAKRATKAPTKSKAGPKNKRKTVAKKSVPANSRLSRSSKNTA